MTHTSETRWQKGLGGQGLNHQVSELSLMMLDVLYKAEKLGLELEELIDYTGDGKKNVAQSLADQLFYEDWSHRESDPLGEPGVLDSCANEAECKKIQDAIDAINAARSIFDFANEATKSKSKISVLRRMG